MAKKDKTKKEETKNQSYSGESIASKLLSGTGIGKLLGYGDNTYTDGYGATREYAPLSESAQGQQLDRMKDTAVDAAKLVGAGAAFGNPITAEAWLAPVITAAQAYYAGAGLHDGINRVESMIEDPSQRTAENVLMTGLETLPVIPAAKTVVKGVKEVVPAAKQMVKEAEAVNYAGRQADAAAATAAKGTINNAGVTDVVKSEPYARIAPSDGRINTAVNYGLRYDPQNTVQLVSDTEPGYYSVHFKTNQGSQTSNNIQSIVDQIVTDLPAGAKLGTWGTVSKGGFSGLNRFGDAGMIKTGEYRPLAFKDQSAASEVAEKYGLTLNADGTINWPIFEKQSPWIITPRWGFGSIKVPGTDVSDWSPAYDTYTKHHTAFLSDKELDDLAEELHKIYPFGFDAKTFKDNYTLFTYDIWNQKKSPFDSEKAVGQTLLRMGKPITYINVPKKVIRFYQEDVIPRLHDERILISNINNILNGKIQVGYLPDAYGGIFTPKTRVIRINDLNELIPARNRIVAHEINHAFRYSPELQDYTFNWKEDDALYPFYIKLYPSKPIDSHDYINLATRREVSATGAENRFGYWETLNDNLNNSNKVLTPEDVDRYIDTISDYDLYSNLFLQNGYNVTTFPLIDSGPNLIPKVPEISEEQLKKSAEKIRNLLKYVPAVGTAAVLPTTMDKSTNTKQESNNQL